MNLFSFSFLQILELNADLSFDESKTSEKVSRQWISKSLLSALPGWIINVQSIQARAYSAEGNVVCEYRIDVTKSWIWRSESGALFCRAHDDNMDIINRVCMQWLGCRCGCDKIGARLLIVSPMHSIKHAIVVQQLAVVRFVHLTSN